LIISRDPKLFFGKWPTDSLVIENLNSSQSRTVALQPPPQEIQLETKEVEVRIEVEQFTEKSLFVPLQVKNIPETDSLSFFPQRVRVRFVVGLSKYNELTDEDFQLEADLEGVSLEKSQIQVPIRLTKKPDFVKNVQFTPNTANFFIVKKDADTEPEQGG
jgi:YbbR domain-containing protein